MAEHINLVVLVKVKPEHIKDAEPIVKELAEKTRKEGGNIKYDVYRVNEKEGVYVILEQFKTLQDIEAHR